MKREMDGGAGGEREDGITKRGGRQRETGFCSEREREEREREKDVGIF